MDTLNVAFKLRGKLISDEDLADFIYDLDDVRGTVRLCIGTWSLADVVNAARFLAEYCKVTIDDVDVETNYDASGQSQALLSCYKAET